MNPKEIYKMFTAHKQYFPHIRFDYVKRKIEANEVFVKNDIAIIFSRYKRKSTTGNVSMQKGDYIIHQIVNTNPGNGKASETLKEFLEYKENSVYLSVREDNHRARRFYEKNDFELAGVVSWKNDTIPGVIYCKTS